MIWIFFCRCVSARAGLWRAVRATVASVFLILFAHVGFAASGKVADPATPDDAFLGAKEALHNGDLQSAAALEARLVQLDPNYPLTSYLDYWSIKLQLLRLNADSDNLASAFVAANEGTLVAELVRRDWLRSLGKRGDFTRFDVEFARDVLNDDPQVGCYAVLSRYVRRARHNEDNLESILAAARTALSVPKDITDEGCYTLGTSLATDGNIAPDDVWEWMRAASDAAQPVAFRRYASLLGTEAGPPVPVLDAVLDKPTNWLAKQGGTTTRNQRELTEIALTRMARSEPEQTAALLDRQWAKQLSAQARGYVWGELSAAAARRQLPQATEWVRRSIETSGLSADVLAWQARAALRAGDWQLLYLVIEKMPPEMRRPQAEDGTWTYWAARVAQTQHRAADAAALLQSISTQFTFYGLLATEELGRPLTVPARARPVTDAELASASALPGFARAVKFYDLNLRSLGNTEWNFSIRNMNDRQLLAAAEWARRNQIYDRTVNTADRTKAEFDFTLRYLAPFREQMQPKADALGLDSAWVYGLIRQESRFVTAARSNVGAQGLMQVMPATARYVARKIGMTDFHNGQEYDLETNLVLGTNYLRIVLDQLDNQPMLATAAYNAGPQRARNWRSTLGHPVEGAIYAETIPISETRDYVKKVMSNAVYYGLLFDPAHPQSLRARLGSISSDGSSTPTDIPVASAATESVAPPNPALQIAPAQQTH